MLLVLGLCAGLNFGTASAPPRSGPAVAGYRLRGGLPVLTIGANVLCLGIRLAIAPRGGPAPPRPPLVARQRLVARPVAVGRLAPLCRPSEGPGTPSQPRIGLGAFAAVRPSLRRCPGGVPPDTNEGERAEATGKRPELESQVVRLALALVEAGRGLRLRDEAAGVVQLLVEVDDGGHVGNLGGEGELEVGRAWVEVHLRRHAGDRRRVSPRQRGELFGEDIPVAVVQGLGRVHRCEVPVLLEHPISPTLVHAVGVAEEAVQMLELPPGAGNRTELRHETADAFELAEEAVVVECVGILHTLADEAGGRAVPMAGRAINVVGEALLRVAAQRPLREGVRHFRHDRGLVKDGSRLVLGANALGGRPVQWNEELPLHVVPEGLHHVGATEEAVCEAIP
mmetsp:Transcript_62821/g.182250  ORF Transcript_62821/g.182250 Transcript_62821/m.182250 type:complete len:396 (+) Transcript_62821:263-1450(+)